MNHSHGTATVEKEGEGTYFLDQLFSILVCGGLGLVAVLMYRSQMLDRMLHPDFWLPVLIGGVVLLILAAIRGIAVWKLVGEKSRALDALAAAEAMPPGIPKALAEIAGQPVPGAKEPEVFGYKMADTEPNTHSHGGVPCDDDHAHGWAPWRYMILAIPVFMYFLDLPKKGFSRDRLESMIRKGNIKSNTPLKLGLAALGGGTSLTPALRRSTEAPRVLKFSELSSVAAVPALHDSMEGYEGIVRGQFFPSREPGEFTLYRMNIKCCSSDAVMLQVRIITQQQYLQGINPGDWIEIKGVINFAEIGTGGKTQWIPVISIDREENISRNAEPTSDYSKINK